MTIIVLLFLIAAILAIVGAFTNPPRVSLLALAVGALAIAFVVKELT